MQNQPNQNPFTILGTPSKVIINGNLELEVEDCLEALHKHYSEILSYILTRINGVVKLYVVAV